MDKCELQKETKNAKEEVSIVQVKMRQMEGLLDQRNQTIDELDNRIK